MLDPRYGPDGFPLPETPEEERQEMYEDLMRGGLSDHEAYATVWPEGRS